MNYALSVSDGRTDIFELNKTTAVISLKTELDREDVAVYTLTVVVTNSESGPPNVPRENSMLTVTVNVSSLMH
jgi:hypothetical protein